MTYTPKVGDKVRWSPKFIERQSATLNSHNDFTSEWRGVVIETIQSVSGRGQIVVSPASNRQGGWRCGPGDVVLIEPEARPEWDEMFTTGGGS